VEPALSFSFLFFFASLEWTELWCTGSSSCLILTAAAVLLCGCACGCAGLSGLVRWPGPIPRGLNPFLGTLLSLRAPLPMHTPNFTVAFPDRFVRERCCLALSSHLLPCPLEIPCTPSSSPSPLRPSLSPACLVLCPPSRPPLHPPCALPCTLPAPSPCVSSLVPCTPVPWHSLPCGTLPPFSLQSPA